MAPGSTTSRRAANLYAPLAHSQEPQEREESQPELSRGSRSSAERNGTLSARNGTTSARSWTLSARSGTTGPPGTAVPAATKRGGHEIALLKSALNEGIKVVTTVSEVIKTLLDRLEHPVFTEEAARCLRNSPDCVLRYLRAQQTPEPDVFAAKEYWVRKAVSEEAIEVDWRTLGKRWMFGPDEQEKRGGVTKQAMDAALNKSYWETWRLGMSRSPQRIEEHLIFNFVLGYRQAASRADQLVLRLVRVNAVDEKRQGTKHTQLRAGRTNDHDEKGDPLDLVFSGVIHVKRESSRHVLITVNSLSGQWAANMQDVTSHMPRVQPDVQHAPFVLAMKSVWTQDGPIFGTHQWLIEALLTLVVSVRLQQSGLFASKNVRTKVCFTSMLGDIVRDYTKTRACYLDVAEFKNIPEFIDAMEWGGGDGGGGDGAGARGVAKGRAAAPLLWDTRNEHR